MLKEICSPSCCQYLVCALYYPGCFVFLRVFDSVVFVFLSVFDSDVFEIIDLKSKRLNQNG